MAGFWTQVEENTLAQGDWLTECLVPNFGADVEDSSGDIKDIPTTQSDLIIITQSCDLENGKAPFVALCPIHTISAFETQNPDFGKKGKWELVRKGRVEGLHLLGSPTAPDDNKKALVVDFGLIFSLPFEQLTVKANAMGNRWRLASPFLEHFSQAFARFFMRVGLPSAIPSFR